MSIAIYLYAYASALPQRFGGAFRRHWRAICIGAFLGWLIGGIITSVVLAIAELHHWLSYPQSNMTQAGVGWACFAFGGVAGYACRKRGPNG